MTAEPLSLSPRQWLVQLRRGIDHAEILAGVEEDARWTGRYLFMVVIGAMLLSPLMGPIVGLGFGLAVWDLVAMRRALVALALGVAVAVGFAALLVIFSPLQTVTD